MKKLIALILSVLLIFGTAVVAFAADGDPDPAVADTKIYFDAAASGWTGFDLIGFHIWAIDDPDFKEIDWGGKKQNGTNEGDGIWSYDTTKVGTIKPGCQYAVIFYAKKSSAASGQQTYNLLFGSDCLGKTAVCDGTIYENPEDSNKTTQAAFWGGDTDPSLYGPQLMVTSIGNVVGTCCPASITPFGLFEFFLNERLANARAFSDKDDQALIDDAAAALGLELEDVVTALEETGVAVEWDEDASPLPHHEPIPGEGQKVPYTVDVIEGEGTASGDKDVLTINYSLPPEYAYDTVTLTATPALNYYFFGWEIEGTYEIVGDATLRSDVLTVKAFDGIKAHAKFDRPDGAPTRVPYTVDVTRGEGTAVGDKDILVINYTIGPEYAYDTVTLTATPAEGYTFVGWEIKGTYEIEGDATRKSPVLTIKARDGIIAHARFAQAGAFVRGDADMDGDVTIMDATRIQRYLAELATEDEIDRSAADADADGDVTIMDATRIQRYLAELCDMDGNPILPKATDDEPIPPQDEYELPKLS